MAKMPQEMMGYDRGITTFSPDGRLLQVEYARKTVSQGTTAIGVVCKDCVVLVADRRVIDPLIVVSGVEKVFQIDTHIAATMSGLISDGRILIERGQEEAQKHKITYGENIDIRSLVKELSNFKQLYTQYAGTRPFGVSLLIAGVDEKPQLFVTEPSGIYFEYYATAIGEGSKIATDYLKKYYKEDMSTEDGVNLAVESLKKVLGPKFDKDRIEAAIVFKDERKFQKVKYRDLEQYMKSSKKSE